VATNRFAEVVLPAAEVPVGKQVSLSFWMRNQNWQGKIDGAHMDVIVNGSLAHKVYAVLSDWTLVSVDLGPWKGKEVEIRLQLFAGNTPYQPAFLDDVLLSVECQ